jgi:hypothetical protein
MVLALLLIICPKSLRQFDISPLGTLIPATEKDYQLLPFSAEIDPIAGAIVHSKLKYTLADGFPVSEVSPADSVYSSLNSMSGFSIA